MPLFSNSTSKKRAEDEDISYADEEEQKSLLASTQAEFQQYKLENEMKLKKLVEEALGKLEDKNETDEEDISVEVKLEEDTFSLMMLNRIQFALGHMYLVSRLFFASSFLPWTFDIAKDMMSHLYLLIRYRIAAMLHVFGHE